MELAPGIFKIKVPIPDNPLEHLNCYLIKGKEGWLMIDTGWYTPETFNSLKKSLDKLGIALTDIATIVVTHIHPDHFGLVGRIRQISPATKLITHKFEGELIESRYIKFHELRQSMEFLLRRHGVPSSRISELKSSSMPAMEFVSVTFPDSTLYGGEIISTGFYDLEVIWTPGHSIGHICLYEPKNRFLFSGDHVLPKITPSVAFHIQSGDDPLGDYLNALHKIEKLPTKKILPAHEEIFTDIHRRVAEIVKHHENRNEEIRKVIFNGYHSAWEISSHITWNVRDSKWTSLSPLTKRLAVMETVAHLEYMNWRGRVKRILRKNLVEYKLL
ncbi:MAG: MBL fold metallo-hydrolase [Deltaproteobacteria bacterium]|nr:MBL fold metallo-hydrolase [Deltaproteobacteria bacterium]